MLSPNKRKARIRTNICFDADQKEGLRGHELFEYFTAQPERAHVMFKKHITEAAIYARYSTDKQRNTTLTP